jgi:hypothetical protein
VASKNILKTRWMTERHSGNANIRVNWFGNVTAPFQRLENHKWNFFLEKPKYLYQKAPPLCWQGKFSASLRYWWYQQSEQIGWKMF